MLGSAVEPVTMATRPENRRTPPKGAVSLRSPVIPSADPIPFIMSCDVAHGCR